MNAPTPCHGRATLFEATTIAAHEEARALCATCPVLAACEATLRDTMRAHGYGPHYGPRGTWAGRLVSKPAATVVRMERGAA